MSVKALNAAIAELPIKKQAEILNVLSNWSLNPYWYSSSSIDKASKELDKHIPGAGLALISLYMVESDDDVALFSQGVQREIEKAGLGETNDR